MSRPSQPALSLCLEGQSVPEKLSKAAGFEAEEYQHLSLTLCDVVNTFKLISVIAMM